MSKKNVGNFKGKGSRESKESRESIESKEGKESIEGNHLWVTLVFLCKTPLVEGIVRIASKAMKANKVLRQICLYMR